MLRAYPSLWVLRWRMKLDVTVVFILWGKQHFFSKPSLANIINKIIYSFKCMIFVAACTCWCLHSPHHKPARLVQIKQTFLCFLKWQNTVFQQCTRWLIKPYSLSQSYVSQVFPKYLASNLRIPKMATRVWLVWSHMTQVLESHSYLFTFKLPLAANGGHDVRKVRHAHHEQKKTITVSRRVHNLCHLSD